MSYIHTLATRGNWNVANLLLGLESNSNGGESASSSPQVFGLSGLDLSSLAARLGRPERRRYDESLNRLTVDNITQLMSPTGPFSQTFSGFEQRPEQIEMLNAVTQAIYQGQRLVVEGGTGVGKSMAYLLPAALFAAARGLRVVISTTLSTCKNN